MKSYFNFSLVDEIISKFVYDMEANRIDIYFTGYFDKVKQIHIENTCMLRIRDWKKIRGKFWLNTQYKDIEIYISIFNIILFMEREGETLKMGVSCLDGNVMWILFDRAVINFQEYVES